MMEAPKQPTDPKPEDGKARIPELVFRPDERAAARLNRVRTAVIIGTILTVAVGFVLVVRSRPSVTKPIIVQPAAHSERLALPAPAAGPVGETVAVARVPASPVTAARSAVATIDAFYGAAMEKWVRAGDLSPKGLVTKENGEDVVARLHRAVILTDSAKADIVRARHEAGFVRQASRDNAGGAAYRLSVLYSAVDAYVTLLATDAADRALYYSTFEAAVRATLVGDDSDAEIKQNVAVSYLRKSEDRQRAIARRANLVREALANLEPNGR